MRRVVFSVGAALGAVEDVIGRVMHQQGVQPPGFLRQDAGRRGVDGQRQLGLRFGAVHGRIGGGIDDDLRPRGPYHGRDPAGVGKIEPGPVEREHLAQRCQRAFQLVSDLAVASGQQDALHG